MRRLNAQQQIDEMQALLKQAKKAKKNLDALDNKVQQEIRAHLKGSGKPEKQYENGRDISLEESGQAFIAMFAMLKGILAYKEYLCHGRSLVAKDYQVEITHLANKVRGFINKSNNWFEGDNKKIWDGDWKRDSGGLTVILEKFMMMSDEQRALLEEISEEIYNGNVTAEKGFVKATSEVPELDQHIEFFTEGNAIPHWGFMQQGNQFYSIRMQKHFAPDEVLCWKPYSTLQSALKQAGIDS